MIVRWWLAELPAMLAELGIERPFLVASARWRALDLPQVGCWSEVPSDRVEVPPEADALLAVGGGSAIDTAKAASAASGLPLVSVPTTYSGAEWTTDLRRPLARPADRRRRRRRAHGRDRLRRRADARPAAPRDGRHGAERARALRRGALRARTRTQGDERRSPGAPLIAAALPRVVAETARRRAARADLLTARRTPGEALALAGLALAHAMAQALGGTFGLPHGAMNALACRPRSASTPRRPRRGRALRRAIGRRRPGARGRGARAPRRLRAAARLRRPRGASCRGVAEAAAAGRQPGEPASRDPGEIEELLPRDLLRPTQSRA